MTAYVCREHPDEPVTRRGAGCWLCAVEDADRLRRRQEKRDLRATAEGRQS